MSGTHTTSGHPCKGARFYLPQISVSDDICLVEINAAIKESPLISIGSGQSELSLEIPLPSSLNEHMIIWGFAPARVRNRIASVCVPLKILRTLIVLGDSSVCCMLIVHFFDSLKVQFGWQGVKLWASNHSLLLAKIRRHRLIVKLWTLEMQIGLSWFESCGVGLDISDSRTVYVFRVRWQRVVIIRLPSNGWAWAEVVLRSHLLACPICINSANLIWLDDEAATVLFVCPLC